MSERDAIRDVEAEQSVLGALLIDRDAIATVSGIVTAQDFHVPAHRTIYAAILALWERKEPADLTTVSAELKARNQLESVGGIDGLIERVPAVAETPAGANRRVIDMADAEILSFGPRSPEIVRAIARALYAPDAGETAE